MQQIASPEAHNTAWVGEQTMLIVTPDLPVQSSLSPFGEFGSKPLSSNLASSVSPLLL